MHTPRDPRDAFTPHYTVPSDIQERIRSIERLDAALGGLQMDVHARHVWLRDALSHNAYGTASIEGNPLSLQEVTSLLAHGPTPERMQVPAEREILNWAAFMEDLDAIDMPSTVEDVCELHDQLFDGVMDETAGRGRIKDRPNYIGRRDGTVIYVPTPPERAAQELQQALDWFHGIDEGPLVRAWLFHHEFEAIHPFLDGNGRLGRALMTLGLHKAGYAGVRFALVDFAFNADRLAYYGALAEAHGGDHTDWLHYLSNVFEKAYSEAVQRFTVGRDARLNPRQAQVAAWFVRVTTDHPRRRVKFGDVHAAFPHLPRRTLQEDIKRLLAAGLIDKEGERKGTSYGRIRPGTSPPPAAQTD